MRKVSVNFDEKRHWISTARRVLSYRLILHRLPSLGASKSDSIESFKIDKVAVYDLVNDFWLNLPVIVN